MDTANLNGLPPLRGAVIALLRIEDATLTVEQLVQEAGVANDRALAYLSILLNLEVVRACGPVGWGRGRKFCGWAESACRSRPRSSSHEASDRMHEIFVQVAQNVKRLREKRDWSMYELAKRAGVASKTVQRLETMRRRNIPFPALMLIAQALDTSVEVLASNC
jgi:DNA-binding Xre family transcriptional regulator